jgi:hypothetical protein
MAGIMTAKSGHCPDIEPQGLAFSSGVSARALMTRSFAPIRWIVPGYVVEGMSLLAGAPKLGKSWLSLGWLLAVASGGYAMGSVLCEQGDALGLMLEDNERRLQRRLRQLALPSLPDRLTLLTQWPTLDEGCAHEIECWIAGVEKPRLVVIDVFARVKGSKGRNETDYDADYRQAAQLQSLAAKHNLAIVAIHHTRKMAAVDPFDEVSGTRGLTGAADSVLILKRDAVLQQPVIYGRGRDLEEVETALQFSKDTGAWTILGEACQIANTAERREVQRVLGSSVEPMTPTEIANRLGKSRQSIQKMLAKMLRDRKVEQVGRGYYCLVTPVSKVALALSVIENRETIETDLHARVRADIPPNPSVAIVAGTS